MAFFLLLLSAGLCTSVISSRYRQYFITKNAMTWTKAQNYCRRNYTDLVTVHNQDEQDIIENFLKQKRTKGRIYIGLHRRNGSLKWSNGDIVSYNTYNPEIERSTPYCHSMSASGSWENVNCNEKKFFMCSNKGEYTLIKKRRSWCEAQTYCRLHHTDLVSINNNTENENVLQKGGTEETFWIGLMHSDWEWSDGACSTYRRFLSVSYILLKEGRNCMILQTASNFFWFSYICHQLSIGLCYKDQIHLIKQTKTWEGALDYCNRDYDGLLRIETPHDQLRLEVELKKEGVSGPVWLGLRQSRLFGFWIWTNGLNVGWSNWEGGSQPEQPLSHICGAMATSGPAKFKWSDQYCLSESYFLCEGEKR